MPSQARLLLSLLLLSAACKGRPNMPAQSMWNGSVELPEGISVPFRMSLDFSGVNAAGFFLVGDEKTPIPEILQEGDSVILGFSEYSAELRLAWNGSGLIGNYLRIRSDGTKSLAVAAFPEMRVSHEPSEEPSRVSLTAGNYQVLFQRDDKVDDTTVAKFWTKDGAQYGTFIAPDGDYGLLVGEPSGRGVQFSRFTGWQAIALVIEPAGASTWSGKFYAASNPKPASFKLRPREDLNVEMPATLRTAMKHADAEFEFSCLSLSGETVRNTDERFKGKALIVDFMGTWCHNCLDEAPVLQRLDDQFGGKGLAVAGLSFEISDDPVLARKNLQLYKDRFGLTYTLLFCGSLDEENVKKRIHSQLDNFFAYPTALFIAKNHKVRFIHNGFKGPGAGDEFHLQIGEFEDLTAKLLN